MTRTVVVTGGGTGIGRAIATAFAKLGDTVVVTGRRREPLDAVVAELGPPARAVVCDGTDPAQVRALAAGLDRVDVLVNNAGGNTDIGGPDPGDDLDALAAAWRANLDANVLTAVLTTAALADRLTDGGTVVNLGSIAADKGAGSYGAAKAAIGSWTVSLAADLGPRGITANVVSPGFVADTEFFRGRMTDTRREALVAATSTRRAGLPDDIAGTVVFLASPAARHVTGQTIAVNGGAWPTR